MVYAAPFLLGNLLSQSSSERYSTKEFKPSSIHVHWRSSLFTIIGKKLCPTSWIITPIIPFFVLSLYVPSGWVRPLLKQIIGYSIPFDASTLCATGYG